MTSCSKVYDPHIDTSQNVLVVDGRITTKTDAYHVVLTYARPFNSSEKNTPANGANVYVTDDMGNSFKFNERDKGDYVSDSLQFTGQSVHIYRLHIVTTMVQNMNRIHRKYFQQYLLTMFMQSLIIRKFWIAIPD
jgi:hypothetical protein